LKLIIELLTQRGGVMGQRLVFGMLLSLAILLGVFAQGIAYFLNENIWAVTTVYYLNIITILGVVMFVATFIYVKKSFKSGTDTGERRNFFYAITIMLAIPTTLWSFFVFAMWQG
jgi:hypothetical protein